MSYRTNPLPVDPKVSIAYCSHYYILTLEVFFTQGTDLPPWIL